MSTDIVHWEDSQRTFSRGALTVYLSLTLPITCFLMCAYIAYQNVKKWLEKKDQKEQDEILALPDV